MGKRKLIRITTVPRSLQSLLKDQLRFMSRHYDVVAVSSDGECFDEMIREQGVRGVRLNMTRQISPLKDLVALGKLIVLFAKERPDIVHTHTPKAGTLGMLAAWITRVPVRLHTVAGLPLLVATGKKRLLLDWVEKLTYRCATRVYPNSHVMKQIIVRNRLAPETKVKVIANGSSNGIDMEYFSPQAPVAGKQTVRRSLKIDENAFVFCFVGRLVKDKGVNELVRSFRRLYEQNERVRLLVVGRFEKELDPLFPDTEEAILHHPGIVYVGFQKDVRPYFSASDALVFPSYREGFPNVVMQAGAMNLPAIVTDINGCNEIIETGKNGAIVPPRDEAALLEAMEYFASHPEAIGAMSARTRPMIGNRYDRQLVWNGLLEEYSRLTGR